MRCIALLLFLFLMGCHSLEISDQQIDEIVNATQDVVAKTVPIVTPVVDPILPGASGGLAVIVAAGVAALVRFGLRALQKRKTDQLKELITGASKK